MTTTTVQASVRSANIFSTFYQLVHRKLLGMARHVGDEVQ